MILITGSKGMLGQHLTKKLENNNINFIAFDKDDLDITKIQDCRNKITKEIDVVINCAAYVNADKAEDEESIAFDINYLGSKNLAIATCEVDAKLLHISTDYVYGNGYKSPISELSVPKPINVYGKSKLAGEQAIQEINKKHFIVRTAWLFGPYGKNFIETMKETSNADVLKVVDDQYGSPTSCEDLVNVILELIKTEKYGLYHASSEGETTWYGFAKYVFDVLNYRTNLTPCTSLEYVTRAKRPTYSVLKNEKLQKEGFPAMPDWKTAVNNYLNKF